jgi:uncharacterized protein (DUF433 family)
MLGKYVGADPAICHGKPTIVGTRIMVWQVLEMLSDGYSHSKITAAWDGKVSFEAIEEARRLFPAGLGKRQQVQHPAERTPS